MTTAPIVRAEPRRATDGLLAVGAIAAGILVLLLRRVVLGTPQQAPVLLQVYAVLGLIAFVIPLPGGVRRIAWPVVIAVGLSAFVAATLMTRIPAALPHGPAVLIFGSIAALGEEAFFRRLVYGVLAHRGAAIAVVGSAALFALVHVPLYGPAAFWVDLGAGLILGWQRWASGSWVPAGVTHVAANLLAVLR
jgi:membrane protease YdiL (CAAX protease family)